ncbi:MAG TPA: hypothetical protein VGJ60_07170 [Chloroflexota bacterium]
MPHLTKHTAAHVEIADDKTKAVTPYLAIRRSSHELSSGEFRKNMSGGLWINLSADRPNAEIVRDLTDAAMAALAFVELAKAEIDARSAPTPIAASSKPGSKGKKAAA